MNPRRVVVTGLGALTPIGKPITTSLIIPAKNESESLPQVLDELIDYNLKTIVILEEKDLKTIDSIKNFKLCANQQPEQKNRY